MLAPEYSSTDSPIFGGYNVCELLFSYGQKPVFEPECDLTDEERLALNRELDSSIRSASAALEQLGVSPYYDYRDLHLIEEHTW